MHASEGSWSRFAWKSVALVAAMLLSSIFAAAPALAALPNCTGSTFGVPHLSVSAAVDVAASSPNPEYCQVSGAIATDGEGAGPGSALFVLKLPAVWNNRFVFFGCGGNCGSVTSLSANGTDIAEALGLGYAVVNTDTGHEQSSSTPDPTWILLAPGVPNTPAITDFFYRAVHQVTVAAKEYVKAYYGGDIQHAYFDGCSTGGRQSLMEGDRYPHDFDGLIAGDSVMDRSGQGAASLKQAKAFLNAYIPFATVAQVDAAIKASCDAADGVADGLIQNPAKCSFDPDSLVPGTLTQAQADALKVYFETLKDGSGNVIYPGNTVSDLSTAGFEGQDEFRTAPTNPNAAEPWGAAGVGPTAWTLGDPGTRYYVEYDPGFDVNNGWPQSRDMITDAALKLLRERLGGADSYHPEKIREFLHRGGKLILYHGFSDPLVSSYRSIWFYSALAEQERGYRALQKSARLFMVPGMGHCGGGPGPNTFDTLRALDNWVTHGVAPDSIMATSSSGRTMPLCKYPEEPSYSGSGDVNSAANWACGKDDQRLFEVGANGRAAGVGGDHDGDRDDFRRTEHEDE
jgi:feruloyl esterase